MSGWHSAFAFICVLAICLGQILFKRVSIEVEAVGTWLNARVVFYAGVAFAVYGGATFLWIYLLRFVELSRAYPVMAFSFVVVPLLSAWLYGDRLSAAYLGGSVLIVAGVIVISRAS